MYSEELLRRFVIEECSFRLQSTLDAVYGPGEIKVHTVNLTPDHIDIALIPLCEGRLLYNPKFVSKNNIPDFLKKWNLIESPSMVHQPFYSNIPKASNWIGLNLLVIDGEEKTVLVEENQLPLVNCLTQNGFRPIPLR